MNSATFINNKTQLLLLGFVFFFFNAVFSQTNLVPNASFEQYTNCPYNRDYDEYRNGKPDFWFKPDNRYATYLNACANDSIYGGVPFHQLAGGNGFQYARTGNAYVLMRHFGSVIPYFEVKLWDSLKAKKKYYGVCYVNSVNSNTTACNSQSMFFSKNATYVDTANYDTLLRTPQVYNYGDPIITDSLNWVKVSGVFTALGGEQYLTLGNFRNSYTVTKRIKLQNIGFNGAGYYYDDIAVYNLDSFNLKADAGRDTSIHIGDSVFIGSYTNGIDTIKWLQNGTISIDSTRPGFWVHPLVNTCYMLTQTVNGYTSSDTVCINVQPLPLKFIQFTAAPTPPKVGLIQAKMDWITANEINVSHFNIQRSTNGKDFITIGKVKANNKVLNEYSFIDNKLPITNDQLTLYYRLTGVDNDGKKQYSQIRNVELGIRNGVSVYPNPAKEVVNIVGNDIKEVRLLNYLGQQIATGTNLSNNSNVYQLNISSLPKGIYLLNIFNKQNNVFNEKLIVQ